MPSSLFKSISIFLVCLLPSLANAVNQNDLLIAAEAARADAEKYIFAAKSKIQSDGEVQRIIANSRFSSIPKFQDQALAALSNLRLKIDIGHCYYPEDPLAIVGAYTDTESPENGIYLCADFFLSDLHRQAVTLIHETMHVAGITENETAEAVAIATGLLAAGDLEPSGYINRYPRLAKLYYDLRSALNHPDYIKDHSDIRLTISRELLEKLSASSDTTVLFKVPADSDPLQHFDCVLNAQRRPEKITSNELLFPDSSIRTTFGVGRKLDVGFFEPGPAQSEFKVSHSPEYGELTLTCRGLTPITLEQLQAAVSHPVILLVR